MADPTEIPASGRRRGVVWALSAVVAIAIVGGAAGAYFGLRGARGAGSTPAAIPPPRAFAAAAFDEATHEVVLFGGVGTGGAALGDTWTWNGSSWTDQHPALSPPARAYAAMTYDPHTHDVLLVGGLTVTNSPPVACSGTGSAAGGAIGSSGSVGSTGSAGSSGPTKAPPPIQPPRAATPVSPLPCAAQAPSPLDDAWLWDGNTWRRSAAPTAVSLDAGVAPSLATDPSNGQVLLLSRGPQPMPACVVPPSLSPATQCPSPGEGVRVWSWNGSGWSALTSPPPPAAGFFFLGADSLVADPVSGHVALFRTNTFVACGAETSGPAVAPCPLNAASGSATAGESLPPIVSPVMVPCCSGSESVWDGSAWSKPITFGPSPTVSAATLVGDPAHHDVLAFSSQGTWAWSGSGWAAQHPSRAPDPAINGETVVYDGASQRVLVFGGEVFGGKAATANMSDALWAWDGGSWTLVNGTAPAIPSPSPTVSLLPAPASPPSLSIPPASPPVVNPGGPCLPAPPSPPNRVCAGGVGIPPPG